MLEEQGGLGVGIGLLIPDGLLLAVWCEANAQLCQCLQRGEAGQVKKLRGSECRERGNLGQRSTAYVVNGEVVRESEAMEVHGMRKSGEVDQHSRGERPYLELSDTRMHAHR